MFEGHFATLVITRIACVLIEISLKHLHRRRKSQRTLLQSQEKLTPFVSTSIIDQRWKLAEIEPNNLLDNLTLTNINSFQSLFL